MLGVVLTLAGLLAEQVAADCQTAPARPTERTAPPPGPPRAVESFQRVAEVARCLGGKHGPESVLVVLDLDNTLLAMRTALGSDQWFRWQHGLIDTPASERRQAAKDLDGLLELLGGLYSELGMRPTDPQAATHLLRLRDEGFGIVILTSRGPEVRAATERALQRAGHADILRVPSRLEKAVTGTEGSPPGWEKLESAMKRRFGSPEEPPVVSFRDGLYLSDGQHKGLLLRALLLAADGQGSAGAGLAAVLFVDDHARHLHGARAALGDRELELVTLRMAAEDAHVRGFENGMRSKRRAHRELRRLQREVAARDEDPEEGTQR